VVAAGATAAAAWFAKVAAQQTAGLAARDEERREAERIAGQIAELEPNDLVPSVNESTWEASVRNRGPGLARDVEVRLLDTTTGDLHPQMRVKGVHRRFTGQGRPVRALAQRGVKRRAQRSNRSNVDRRRPAPNGLLGPDRPQAPTHRWDLHTYLKSLRTDSSGNHPVRLHRCPTTPVLATATSLERSRCSLSHDLAERADAKERFHLERGNELTDYHTAGGCVAI
jgi:hypothetical protein